jgi:hypothetical protein
MMPRFLLLGHLIRTSSSFLLWPIVGMREDSLSLDHTGKCHSIGGNSNLPIKMVSLSFVLIVTSSCEVVLIRTNGIC